MVIFWDTSAIIPLLVDEPSSKAAREFAKKDPSMVVWWATPIECVSALARRAHERILTARDAAAARRVLVALQASWVEVLASEDVRDHAIRVLGRHRIRAADALQLAAALTWARGRPRAHRLVSFDGRLADAGRGEGFDIVIPAA